MNAIEAYETYVNGNISDFKEWLNKKATRRELIHVAYLWKNDGRDLMNLKGYIEEKRNGLKEVM